MNNSKLSFIAILLSCVPTLQKTFDGFQCTQQDDTSPPFGERKYHVRVKHEDSKPLRVKPLKAYDLEIRSDSDRIINELVLPAVRNWTKHLRPKHPLTSTLRVKQQCKDEKFVIAEDPDESKHEYCVKGCVENTICGRTTIPSYMLGPCRHMVDGKPVRPQDVGYGVPYSDFLLIVDVGDTPQCQFGLHAYAMVCEIDPLNNRPLVGHIHLCPHLLFTLSDDLNFKINVATHELGHALGMNTGMYAFMLDEDGKPLTERDPKTGKPNNGFLYGNVYKPSEKVMTVDEEVYKSAKGTFHRPVYRLRTEKMLAAVKEHFGCPDLYYVQLENQGGPFTMGAHLEKRHYNGELMVGSTGSKMLMTNITLGFFEDSGWYHVDYTGSSNLTWGYGTGCYFPSHSCYEYQDYYARTDETPFPWCYEVQGKCEVLKYPTPLENMFQYFTQSPGIKPVDLTYYGGPDQFMDYCPYHVDAE